MITVVFGKKGYGKTSWLLEYLYANATRYQSIRIFDPMCQFEDDPRWEFFSVADLGDLAIDPAEVPWPSLWVLDEVDLVAPSSGVVHPQIYDLIHFGRHLVADTIAASRRPSRVSRDLTSQADRMVLLRLTEPRCIDYVKEYADIDETVLRSYGVFEGEEIEI